MGLGGFADRRFGDGNQTPDTIELATTASALPGFLEDGEDAALGRPGCSRCRR